MSTTRNKREQHEISLWLNDINPDDDCIITFEIVSWPTPAKGPTYDCGGEPSDPGEFNIIKIVALDCNGEAKDEEIDVNDLSEEDEDAIADAIYDKMEEIKYARYQGEQI